LFEVSVGTSAIGHRLPSKGSDSRVLETQDKRSM